MKKNAVLVTGGAGYIGAHACKILAQNNFLPVCFDNLSIKNSNITKWGPSIIADLRKKKSIDKALKKYAPIAVMHFAGSSLVSESMTNPIKYYENNIYCTLNLLKSMAKFKIPYIIFSSTCATYGAPQKINIPLNENHQQNPISPYGKTKLINEFMLEDFEKAYGIKYCCLRYFNAAGADFDAEIGEKHPKETHLIPLLLKTALGLQKSIDIYGTDYKTKDGSAIRDYIHVVDLIDAHIKALNYLIKQNKSIKLNIGTGKGVSVLEVIAAVKNIIKKDFKINYTKKRPGDPPILFADSKKAQNILKWKPKYSDIKTIIKTAWKWEKKLFSKK